MITLISNTGLQFHTIEVEFNNGDNYMNQMGFIEEYNPIDISFSLDMALNIPNSQDWAKKTVLINKEYYDPINLRFTTEDINYNEITVFSTDDKVFTVNSLFSCIDLFKGKWLPIPMFIESGFGPVNWCRMMIVPLECSQPNKRRYNINLVFDTKTSSDPNSVDSLYLHNFVGENKFQLTKDEYNIKSFCDSKKSNNWMYEYLVNIIHNGSAPIGFPNLKFIGQYIYLIKRLSDYNLNGESLIPTVVVYPDNRPDDRLDIPVDMVIDVGNSNTCALLFENNPTGNFNFENVKPLKIQNLSITHISYSDPFSTTLAFVKANFGEITTYDLSRKFEYPSTVRIGKEAKDWIRNSNLTSIHGQEVRNYHSSPKRYLWDNDPVNVQWEFSSEERLATPFPVAIRDFTTQFGYDGNFGGIGASSNYSKRSLMIFVFAEIFNQALMQINSHEFRKEHGGNIDVMRFINNVIITCPTAMSKSEQIILRQCAFDAIQALDKFYKNYFVDNGENTPQDYKSKFKRVVDKIGNMVIDESIIAPFIKDLKRKKDTFHERRDWNYDESTCIQLGFVYAEISKRYANKHVRFFDLYGKLRDDSKQKTIRIASLDTGGGTSDIMICEYSYLNASYCTLKPKPLFWESFTVAGDEFLHEFIKQVIIGDSYDDKNNNIYSYLINLNNQSSNEIINNLNGFFKTWTGRTDKLMRHNFTTQIAIPAAISILDYASNNKSFEKKTFSFRDLFEKNPPNKDIIIHFDQKFNCKIEDIEWELSYSHVNKIVEMKFDNLLRTFSLLAYTYQCDFILLGGKIMSLDIMKRLILKHYPLSSDRVISLNKYRIGQWLPQPIANESGYIADAFAKSTVCIGAIIGLKAGRSNRIDGFNLDMSHFREEMDSTANYIFTYNKKVHRTDLPVFDKYNNDIQLLISNIPTSLVIKQLNLQDYPSNLYMRIDIDDKIIKNSIDKRFPELSQQAKIGHFETRRQSILNSGPFTVVLNRIFDLDKEEIFVQTVMDKIGQPISEIILKLDSLQQENGYWLDSGEYTLTIQPKI